MLLLLSANNTVVPLSLYHCITGYITVA